jgi:hypothetical protein
MFEVFIIITLILIIIVFKYNDNKGLVIGEKNNLQFWVRDLPDKDKAIEVLTELRKNLFELLVFIDKNNSNTSDYKKFKKYIPIMMSRLETVKIKETPQDSPHTSYSVNKGEELVFCIRSKKNNQLHSNNELLYVAIHELAHIGCPEIGHTKLFFDLNIFLLKEAVKFNIYKYKNYNDEPLEYCGIELNNTILN